MIFANIMAELLIEMSPYLAQFLQKDGYIVLSGIITQRLEAAKDSYVKAGYKIISQDTKDNWCSVVVQIK